ncbi:methyltransferase domain-containing protein [Sphingomonas lutea]|uniref:Methyltransferase domain-containing protein n=1 Tax=Sphingomonas lutea TaxID=1045317 RepID=A0A7G9SEW2_9SPHN|nr:class I SAM-dependent methyltransferase [Sphingomonas lutea]QNN66387.1 methyltransferase domain-containing protein [Sphingomonas lutea]
MSMEVLQNRQQIESSRRELVRCGLSAVPGPVEKKVKELITRSRLARPLIVGDVVKSWDVLKTVRFLQEKIQKSDPVLDIGCYASEVIVSLHKAGFADLTGIDLNAELRRMPHADSIRYVQGDFLETPFEDASFAAVASISVIEHGFDAAKLLCEIARILRPGGYFTASFDYWRKKVDTRETRFFDMDWLIFSEDDVRAMIDVARANGFKPIGDLRFETSQKAISHGGFEYTFGWIALQRSS